jgi:hypothetical protein
MLSVGKPAIGCLTAAIRCCITYRNGTQPIDIQLSQGDAESVHYPFHLRNGKT